LGLTPSPTLTLAKWCLVHRAVVDPKQPATVRLCVGGERDVHSEHRRVSVEGREQLVATTW
jgi:hypothetical protein